MIDFSGISPEELKAVDKLLCTVNKCDIQDLAQNLQAIMKHATEAEDLNEVAYIFGELGGILRKHKNDKLQLQLLSEVNSLKVSLMQQVPSSDDWEMYKYFYDEVYALSEFCDCYLTPKCVMKNIALEQRQWIAWQFVTAKCITGDELAFSGQNFFKQPFHMLCPHCGTDIQLQSLASDKIESAPRSWEGKCTGFMPENTFGWFGHYLAEIGEEDAIHELVNLYGNYSCMVCGKEFQPVKGIANYLRENDADALLWSKEMLENAFEYAAYLLNHYRRNQAAFWMNLALAQQKKRTGEYTVEVAEIYEKFMPIYILSEHEEQRIEACEKRVVIYEKLDSYPIGLADSYTELACAYHVLWEDDSEITYHTSLNYVDKAVELYNQELGEGNEKALKAQKSIARVLTFTEGTAPIGIDVLKKELEKEKAKANPNFLTIIDLNSTISQSYSEQLKDVKAAIPYSLEEVEYTCRQYGAESDMAANSYSELAELYERAKDYVNAAEYYEKALDINIHEMGKIYLLPKIFKIVAYQARKLIDKDKESGDLMPKVMCAVDSLNDIGRLHHRSKDYKKAISSHTKALELLQWLFDDETMEIFAEIHYNLGKDYYGIKDKSKAGDEYNVALKVYQEILRREYSDESKESIRQRKRITKLMDKIEKDMSKIDGWEGCSI